jgi:hypothetical protein
VTRSVVAGSVQHVKSLTASTILLSITASSACFERGPLESGVASIYEDAVAESSEVMDAGEGRSDSAEVADTRGDTAPQGDTREPPSDAARDTDMPLTDSTQPPLDTSEPADVAPEVAEVSDTVDADSSIDSGTEVRACLIDAHCDGLVATDRCLGPYRCIDYGCRQDASLAPVCESGDPCEESRCEPETGLCVSTPVCSCEAGLTLRCGGRAEWSSNDLGLHPPFAEIACGPSASPSPVRLVAFEGTGRVRIEANENVSAMHVLDAPSAPESMACQPDSCVAGATFSPSQRALYFDAGPGADFTLSVVETGPNRLVSLSASCSLASEKWCADGVDDELDGLTDCSDPDCAEESRCLETCLDPGLVTWCWEQTSDFISPGQGRSTNYTCDPSPQPGREHVFRFRPYYSETVRFGFWGADGLSLKLLSDSGDGCSPRDCLETSSGDLWFDVVANTTYYLVVDASHTFGGSFMIDFDCNPLRTE